MAAGVPVLTWTGFRKARRQKCIRRPFIHVTGSQRLMRSIFGFEAPVHVLERVRLEALVRAGATSRSSGFHDLIVHGKPSWPVPVSATPALKSG